MTENKPFAVERWHFAGHAQVRVSRCRASTLDEAVAKAERLAELPDTTRVRISKRDSRGRYAPVRVWALRRPPAAGRPIPSSPPELPPPGGSNSGL